MFYSPESYQGRPGYICDISLEGKDIKSEYMKYRKFSLTWATAMQISYNKRKILHLRKRFNSHRISLGHQRGRRFIILGYAGRDVTNPLYLNCGRKIFVTRERSSKRNRWEHCNGIAAEVMESNLAQAWIIVQVSFHKKVRGSLTCWGIVNTLFFLNCSSQSICITQLILYLSGDITVYKHCFCY